MEPLSLMKPWVQTSSCSFSETLCVVSLVGFGNPQAIHDTHMGLMGMTQDVQGDPYDS